MNRIPCTQTIFDYIDSSELPLTLKQICVGLDFHEKDQIENIDKRLKIMVRDGQIDLKHNGTYDTVAKKVLVKGVVKGYHGGHGLVRPLEGDGQEIYLSSAQMRELFSGDLVLVRVERRDHRRRIRGSIESILERATTKLVGRYFRERGIGFFRPCKPGICEDILIPDQEHGTAKANQVVQIEIVEPPSKTGSAIGRVTKVLGEHNDPNIEVEIAIHSHSIPSQWSDEVCAEVDAFQEKPCEAQNRVDLRDLPFVTIDGEDAKDFDDAVYCESKSGGGWKLIVAISDVAHFVKQDSSIDKEAARRGNSVYFHNRVLPMLPEKLSDNLCSLLPGTDRFSVVCEIHLDERAHIYRYKFYEAIIRSHKRVTYGEVSEIIENGNCSDGSERFNRDASWQFHLGALNEMCELLLRRRKKRGALDFEVQETRILSDSQGKIIQIIPVVRTRAHQIIEESMLCANFCAAHFLKHKNIPTLYRVHAEPDKERLKFLREFLAEIGLCLAGGEEPQPKDYQQLLSLIRGREDNAIIQSVLLRSMSQAVYQPNNQGHFGLSYDGYVHFTSPIRRYADLMVHRCLKDALRYNEIDFWFKNKCLDSSETHYSTPHLEKIGTHLSFTERRADEAAREVVNSLKCHYLVDRLGQNFFGVVSAVTGFGLFVMIGELHIEGLIHIKRLPRDYYYFERAKQRLVGERSGLIYKLGQRVEVVLADVHQDERKIDLSLVWDEQTRMLINRLNERDVKKGRKSNRRRKHRS